MSRGNFDTFIITSIPGNSLQRRRNASRILRFILFRSTAPETTRFPTANPRRALLLVFNLASKKKFSLVILRSKGGASGNFSALVNRYPREKIYLFFILNAESRSPFGSSRSNYISSATRFHSHQKPMGTFSFRYRRLVSSFHWRVS